MRALLLVLALVPASIWAQKDALLLHASFDSGVDADTAKGDKKLYTATSYKDRGDAKPGLHHSDASHVPGRGRNGTGALEFRKKNEKAVYFQGAGNTNYAAGNLSGTVSFWLKLDPETDLAPGFCDPIQITDEAYNDSAIWVDFTKDEKPRHFRLGVFGELKVWNPQNLPPDKFPAFAKRLVAVKKTPFAKDKWTNVAITFDRLGSGNGTATLYLNGQSQGTTESIPERFEWDQARSAIRLGVNYVGLFDDLTVFSRPLTAAEVKRLAEDKIALR